MLQSGCTEQLACAYHLMMAPVCLLDVVAEKDERACIAIQYTN